MVGAELQGETQLWVGLQTQAGPQPGSGPRAAAAAPDRRRRGGRAGGQDGVWVDPRPRGLASTYPGVQPKQPAAPGTCLALSLGCRSLRPHPSQARRGVPSPLVPGPLSWAAPEVRVAGPKPLCRRPWSRLLHNPAQPAQRLGRGRVWTETQTRDSGCHEDRNTRCL